MYSKLAVCTSRAPWRSSFAATPKRRVAKVLTRNKSCMTAREKSMKSSEPSLPQGD